MRAHGTRKLGIPKDGIDSKTFARDGNTRKAIITSQNTITTRRSTKEETTYINNSHFDESGSFKICIGGKFTWVTKPDKTKPKGIFGFKVVDHVSMVESVTHSVVFVGGAREFKNSGELFLGVFQQLRVRAIFIGIEIEIMNRIWSWSCFIIEIDENGFVRIIRGDKRNEIGIRL
jgi:hypothetical protein